MKRKHKIAFGFLAVGLSALVLSSCTANFCSVKEKSRILFAIEPGVSTYFNSLEEAEAAKKTDTNYKYLPIEAVPGTSVYQLVEMDGDKYTKSVQLNTIIDTSKKNGIIVPIAQYFAELDRQVLYRSIEEAKAVKGEEYFINIDKSKVEEVLTEYGYIKYFGSTTDKSGKTKDALWSNYEELNDKIAFEKGIEFAASSDFVTSYKKTLETSINNNRSCITNTTGNYGSYGSDVKGTKTQVKMEAKDWGYAWGQGGALIEGLIVYPVSCLIDAIAFGFAGHNPANFANGVPQLLALLFATIIVRLVIFLLSFKSTLSQQKMTRLQPELAKIQAKYPNSNTNQAQKQRLAEEQMRLYKKNKVNPLSALLVLIIQFPVFIGVWGAMTGNAVLSTGAFLELNLSTSVWDALTKVNKVWSLGWWVALILFLLMAISQFLAMKVPQWIQKKKNKKIARLGKNPAQSQQNKTMNIVSWVMLIMIIFMGFTLPAAMGFYWFIGAIVSLAQSLITTAIANRKQH